MQSSVPFKLKASELKALAVRRDAPAAWRTLGHLGAIGVVGTCLWLARGSAWALPLLFLQGYMVAFLFNALHETAHQTAFRSRALNGALGRLAGFAILLPYEYYRAFHWEHHRHTQDPERDPELAVPFPDDLAGLWWYLSGMSTWIARSRLLLKHALLGRVTVPWVGADKRDAIVREARFYLAGYAAVAVISVWAGSWVVPWTWLLPAFIGLWFLRPYLLSEHTGCAHSADMLENTRTTYTNRFVHFFAWNMPYHAEHHAYPAVPFHELPRLNALMAEHLRVSAQGYPAATAAALRHMRTVREARRSTPAPIRTPPKETRP